MTEVVLNIRQLHLFIYLFLGEDICDSESCIQHIATALDKDLDSHLSESEKSVSRAMSAMINEKFYWMIVMERMVFGRARHAPKIMDVGETIIYLYYTHTQSCISTLHFTSS